MATGAGGVGDRRHGCAVLVGVVHRWNGRHGFELDAVGGAGGRGDRRRPRPGWLPPLGGAEAVVETRLDGKTFEITTTNGDQLLTVSSTEGTLIAGPPRGRHRAASRRGAQADTVPDPAMQGEWAVAKVDAGSGEAEVEVVDRTGKRVERWTLAYSEPES